MEGKKKIAVRVLSQSLYYDFWSPISLVLLNYEHRR